MYRLPTFIVLIWSFISTIVFAIGIGFAGGMSEVFVGPPATDDFLSKALWVAAWVMIAAPFALLLFRLVRYLRADR